MDADLYLGNEGVSMALERADYNQPGTQIAMTWAKGR